MHDDTTAFVGLDVHKEAIAIAVAEPGRAPARFLGTVRPALAPLTKALAHLGSPKRLAIVYEAGPCGYGLARRLLKLGYLCDVVAPGKIPQRPGERIKTDRRDALTLASFARSGELTPVLIPDEPDEAMRDLARAREDAVRARLKARQQLKAMLLRHGHHYTGSIFWSAAHQRDLAKLSPAHNRRCRSTTRCTDPIRGILESSTWASQTMIPAYQTEAAPRRIVVMRYPTRGYQTDPPSLYWSVRRVAHRQHRIYRCSF